MNSSSAPFDLLICSWPFPLPPDGFEPHWQAQLTHLRPVPGWSSRGCHSYWTIDWGELFRGGVRFRGTMHGFGVVFRIRVSADGQFAFVSDGYCEIRRGELLLFRGPASAEASLDARVGEILDIAVAHGNSDWTWGARVADSAKAGPELVSVYLPRVLARLRLPDGPPLKVFTDARDPMRTVISIYSMILNGYSPSQILLYGGYQWKPFVKTLLAQFLPFAVPIPLSGIHDQVARAASSSLVDVAKDHWYVMKTCVSLLCEPSEFCMMDDDLFVLESVSGAQALSRVREFVFVPENDNADLYRSIWGEEFEGRSMPNTARVNTALFWLNMRKDRTEVAARMVRGLNKLEHKWAWEQGFYAHLFAGDDVQELPPASWWYPFFGGLPGGMMGYDYANNPCRFTMVHFGGDVDKPSDGEALQLMHQILGRSRRSQ